MRGSAPLLVQQGLSESLAGRFEILDLSHGLLLVLFAEGEAAAPQATLVRLEDGRFLLRPQLQWQFRYDLSYRSDDNDDIQDGFDTSGPCGFKPVADC